MTEIPSTKPETEGQVVTSIALEMKRSIVLLAGTRQASDTRESMIARAARRANISFRQAKALFYGETRDPRASIVESVRSAIRATETENLSARFIALETTLAHVDPEFFGPAVEALREAARALGGQTSAPGSLVGSMARKED